MAAVILSWLNKNAIKQFIERGSMDEFEKDLHEAGEKQLLIVIERICDNREDFIVDLDKPNIKNSSLEILSHNDRKVFEFRMSDNDKTEKSYVGKQFTLVRGRKSENEEERKRNINDGYNRVLRELYIWNKLRNLDNFVQLLHISLDDGKSITAVSESFHRDVHQSLSAPGIDFTTIIKGIAKGLDFLHKFSDDIPTSGSTSEPIKKIAHSDVKCANVFLKADSSIPYLADFGVSHQVVEGTFTKMIVTSGAYAIGTAPWMPPELLIPENVKKALARDSDDKATRIVTYTTESDVWSFGMTIYEIVTRSKPWAQDATKGLAQDSDIQRKILKAMKKKVLPNWPATIPQPLQMYSDSLRDLHNQCCKYVPDERITMEKVVEKLDEIFM